MILGAIAGDIIGSVYERNNIKSVDFELFSENSKFTDDTVLTIATMKAIIDKINYMDAYQIIGRKYPGAGYGGNFHSWLMYENPRPYNSWGNGSAMRVSPIGWAFNTIEEVLEQAKLSAECSHNHPEGIKGAQAIASCIYLAKNGCSKEDIKSFVEINFNYNLNRKIEDIRPNYRFDVSCQGSVPESIIAFLESSDFESSLRLAISIGGDSDTISCMAGSIAEAFYGNVPIKIQNFVIGKLTNDLLKIINDFSTKFI